MCGIVGFWAPEPQHGSEQVIRRMTDSLTHRGPDGSGIWIDAQVGLALGHRRLAIIDLSKAGDQPMASADGRYQIVFNGEIYNHLALRRELEQSGEAPRWRGHSDTETLVASFAAWGVDGTLERLNGMFALALWDTQQRVMYLARDRFGEKPLYYGWQNGVLMFASELRALRHHPAWVGEIDRDTLGLYLQKNNYPEPHTVYRHIRKLPAAHVIGFTDAVERGTEPRCYWDVTAIAQEGLADPSTDDDMALTDGLDRRLADAVALRMRADVPLGAFLSGGVDSSLVVALMQAQSTDKVRTFSIGFRESGFDEAPHARAVAEHLGTDHTELYVTAQDGLDLVRRLPEIWDEPFADPSQIPTYLLAALTRQSVTVSLSGDGADELLGGYKRYPRTEKTWNQIRSVPPAARPLVSGAAHCLSGVLGHIPGREENGVTRLANKFTRIGDMVALMSCADVYQFKTEQIHCPTAILNNTRPPRGKRLDDYDTLSPFPIPDRLMHLDSIDYLTNDVLTKVDRASMSVSLEARIPLLDHTLVEFIWSLPGSAKIRDGRGKWILREVLNRYVPKALVDRPKSGFSVPIAAWLSGSLRDWAEELLDARRLQQDGYFNVAAVRKMWDENASGRRPQAKQLWNILMFQAWLESTRTPA